MPGKVNPVVPEVVDIVAFRVMANDYAVTLAAHSGQLQLNAYEPLDGSRDRSSRSTCSTTCRRCLRTKCVDGITVNEKVLAHYMETTIGIVTALNPVLGYDKATELANEALEERQGHPRGHSREEDPHRGADQGSARSDQADQPGPNQVQEVVSVTTIEGDAHEDSMKHCSDVARVRMRSLVRIAAPSRQKKPKIVILATGGTIAGAAPEARRIPATSRAPSASTS